METKKIPQGLHCREGGKGYMWNKEVERMRKRSIGNSSTKLVPFNHMQEEIQETTIQLNILNNADFIIKMINFPYLEKH